MSVNLNTELQEQIRVFQEEMLPKIPKPVLDTVAQATTDLVRSGIAERALLQGSKAPDFSLPNVRGEQVRFSEVLQKGPAVLTFYRGGW